MTRKFQLSPEQLFRLDLACKPLVDAFGDEAPPYLVGSVSERPDFRDVDVRMILRDKKWDRVEKALGPKAFTFLSFTVAGYLREATGLPVDFQFQRLSDANELHEGSRNPLGRRSLDAWTGDATPRTWRPPVEAP